MAKDYYLPSTDSGRADFLDNFAAKLPEYEGALGLSEAEDITPVQQAAVAFRWALMAREQYDTAAQQWTAFKNILRNGPEGTPLAYPVNPAVPAAPTLPEPGIFKWVARLVTRIKAHNAYTTAIGENLGIIGAEGEEPPVNDRPGIQLRLVSGGQPEIVWRKNDYDALEIEVDRGAGFSLLTIDTNPNYIDTHALPATPTLWKYRAIYRKGDARAGLWSDTAAISVHD